MERSAFEHAALALSAFERAAFNMHVTKRHRICIYIYIHIYIYIYIYIYVVRYAFELSTCELPAFEVYTVELYAFERSALTLCF